MLFYQKFGSSASLSLLLLSKFAFSIPAAPGVLFDREKAAVSLTVANTTLSSSTPISTSVVTTDAPSTNRTKCSPQECPKYCTPSNSTNSTLGSGLLTRSLGLSKRFFEIPSTKPGTFVNQLLTKPYTDDISPDPTTYVWHSFADNAMYASAIKGLCGCTAVFAASPNGVFSAHIWEEDKNTNADLQTANYQNTLNTMSTQLALHRNALVGGEVFIILPTLTRNRRLYSAAINQAIEVAVNQASGLTATVSTYVPRDWKTTAGFGDDERGAAAFQFDPNYQTNGNRAYRIYMENRLLSEQTGL